MVLLAEPALTMALPDQVQDIMVVQAVRVQGIAVELQDLQDRDIQMEIRIAETGLVIQEEVHLPQDRVDHGHLEVAQEAGLQDILPVAQEADHQDTLQDQGLVEVLQDQAVATAEAPQEADHQDTQDLVEVLQDQEVATVVGDHLAADLQEVVAEVHQEAHPAEEEVTNTLF